MSDPIDELDERIEELTRHAQADWDRDSVGSTIEHLRTLVTEIEIRPSEEGMLEEIYTDGFEEGFRYALHTVESGYIQYSGRYWCACPNGRPFPEERVSGWYCAYCGGHLADLGEVVLEMTDHRSAGHED